MDSKLEDDLLQDIESRLTSRRSFVIGIDGFMESGKSRFVMQLASELGGFRISFDSYLEPGSDEPHYIDKLHLKYLSEDLKKIREKFQIIVIEGICLLEVLDRIGFQLDYKLYVKRIGINGLWYDGDHLNDYMEGRAIQENGSSLHKSEFDYHAERLPHENVDYVYERFASE